MQHFLHHSEENYLKTLYKLENTAVKKVNNTALARALELNPATVLEMIRKLIKLKMVAMSADKSIRLTETGRKKAVQVIRRHRLWEVFLVNKLNYKWNEVHDLAEQMEHIESDDLVGRLERFLGFPATDPHGDPIPDAQGRIKKIKTQPLSTAPTKQKLSIISLANSSVEFLNYLDKVGLSIGDTIEIAEIEPFDNSLSLKHKKNYITVSKETAENLFVTL